MSKRRPPDPDPVQPPARIEPPPGAWWNAIARAWFVRGASGEPERLDPQPSAPLRTGRVIPGGVTVGGRPLPPAVKVMA